MINNNLNLKKRIDAYVKGTLTEQEITALWVEFAKHPELLDELEIEVGVKELLSKSSKKTPAKKQAKVTRISGWTWIATAAAAVLIVGFLQMFKIPAQTQLEPLLIAEIPSDQLETYDGIRAKDLVISKGDSLLNLGFSAYLSGNLEKALLLYNEVIAKYDVEPYGSKAFLNSGIIYYNKSDYSAAITAFKEALDRVEDSRMIEEKAWWFLGNALVNIGELEQAREAVYNAYALEGVFRKPAFLLLQKLNYDLGYQQIEETVDK